MTQKRVACLLAQDFQDEEMTTSCQALREHGFEVDVVGGRGGETLRGKHGRAKAEVTCDIESASQVRYLGMLIPGGASARMLAEDPRFQSFVREFDSSGKPIAAICSGPRLLLAAGLGEGRTMTANAEVRAMAERAGATCRDQAMVADRNWITSRRPEDLGEFCAAMVTQFESNANQSWMARGDIHPEG